jgi:hypothetical protein
MADYGWRGAFWVKSLSRVNLWSREEPSFATIRFHLHPKGFGKVHHESGVQVWSLTVSR